MSSRIGSILIENVQPELDGGRYPVKRVAGETATVEADLFKEGHDVLVAVVRWRQASPKGQETDWQEVPMKDLGGKRPVRESVIEPATPRASAVPTAGKGRPRPEPGPMEPQPQA